MIRRQFCSDLLWCESIIWDRGVFKWIISSCSAIEFLAYLDEQRPPGDEEQDDRQDVGEEGGGDVEEVGGGAVRRRGLAGGVHADLREKRENKMQN